MKGKKSIKGKVVRALLLAMSFVLTVVLTATITLAWFYDSDWASGSALMAGTVGIEMRDNTKTATNGEGALHFLLSNNNLYGYPGEAIDVSASVFNNGGTSIVNHFGSTEYDDEDIGTAGQAGVGSPCYIRAHFLVYTNIGHGEADASVDQLMNKQSLYEFLVKLVETQNSLNEGYHWYYYRNSNASMPLEGKYYYNGTASDTQTSNQLDDGYFYLCYENSSILKPLTVGDSAAFLWNDRFVIPWQLTNASADKKIFVGLSFQAVQTYIPIMNSGIISTQKDNQLDANLCTFDRTEVQTVFNSSYFEPIDTEIDGFDFAGAEAAAQGYEKASIPTSPQSPTA